MGVGSLIAVLVVILLSIVIISVILAFYNFTISPIGFILVIISGVVAFLGYLCGNFGSINCSKFCFNLSPLILFFGMIALEMVLFGQYFPKTKVPATSCTNSESNVINIASCILTGYKVSGEYSTWTWTSFWLFYIILPFAFIFAFLFGLLYPFGEVFGGGTVGKSVTSVLSFVISAYGTRQFFGSYLLDLFGYGTWGLVGIFVPLFLSFGLKRIFDMFLKPIEGTEKTLLGGMFSQIYSELNRINEKIDDAQKAMSGETPLSKEAYKAIMTELETLRNEIKVLEGAIDKLKASAATKRQLRKYVKMVENKEKEAEKIAKEGAKFKFKGTGEII